MRVHLKLSKSKEIAPFNYQNILAGTLHKWHGKNNTEHDSLSLYSFSWLQGGKATEKGMDFSRGAEWFISAYDTNFIKNLIKGIQDDPMIAWGMKVNEIYMVEDPLFPSGMVLFKVASPVFVKRSLENHIHFFYPPDPKADEYLTETLKRKLRKAGLDDSHVEVGFDPSYPSPKIKKITYKGIESKASFCPVFVSGSPEQLAFAWNVGVGNSTGIGFGALI